MMRQRCSNKPGTHPAGTCTAIVVDGTAITETWAATHCIIREATVTPWELSNAFY